MARLTVSSVVVAQVNTSLPTFKGPWFEFVVTNRITYLRAKRKGLELCVPYGLIAPQMEGLANHVETYVHLDCGLLPAAQLEGVRRLARTPVGQTFTETLFYLVYSDSDDTDSDNDTADIKWMMPQQRRSVGRVEPLGEDRHIPGIILELHTHPDGVKGFSMTDDADETGLRVYAILVGVDSDAPELYARVSVFGRRVQIPARWVFELPVGWSDPFGDAMSLANDFSKWHLEATSDVSLSDCVGFWTQLEGGDRDGYCAER